MWKMKLTGSFRQADQYEIEYRMRRRVAAISGSMTQGV